MAQTPQPQILQPVDQGTTVTLSGNVHPLAAAATSSVAADLGTPMQHMVLHLRATAAQEAALDELIAAQNNPKSPLYHQYLTPQAFAAQFGAAPSDIAKITAWLESSGLRVEQVPAGNRSVVFSGTTAQVNRAFQTEIRQYNVAGVSHYANATDPKIPAALADAVGGVVKLHDFRHASNISTSQALTAVKLTNGQWTNGANHYVTPADYGTIYDINPLYKVGINGTGQSIAVIARTGISLSDVENFRSTFGLKANDPHFIITNSDPGVVSGDDVETTLDTEWAGAIAPNATIKVIISSSGTSDGIDLSSLYAVNNNVAPIISLSYGSCEAGMGASELNFYNSLWKQAASQGQSVVVAAGDSGAAGCDYGIVAKDGRNVNGLCSSPYSTCVGGTEFADTVNPGQYWLTANSATFGSAISYIPEGVWNESGSVKGGSGLWAGGGGASLAYSKPSWQTGPGVPADGKRDVPDVSLTAATHDGYFIGYHGGFYTVGGTSASTPSFAGMVALIDQKMSASQGLLNTTLYPLAAKQAAGGAAVFHDITTGNNSVPGAAGFSATAGYDQASGLGTVDANLLVNHWTDLSAGPSLSLAASSSSLSVIAGQSAQTTITSTAAASLKAEVVLAVNGAPAGLTVTFAQPAIASPGSGTDVLKVVAAPTLAAGTYNLTVTGAGGGQSAATSIAVVVATPSFTISANATSLTVARGASMPLSLSVSGQNSFNSLVALSVSGLPTGVAAVFAPPSATVSAGSMLTIAAGSNASPGTSTLTITGTSGSLRATTSISLVIISPSLTLTASANSLTLPSASSQSLTVNAVESGLAYPVAFSVTGLPAGVTAAFSPATLSASGSSTVRFTSSASVAAGTYSIGITATGAGLTSKATVSLVVPSPSFTVNSSVTSVSVAQGAGGQLAVSMTPQNGFSSAVALSVMGLPGGVTGSFSTSTLSGAASVSTLALTAATSSMPGSYPITINGTGGGVTKTAVVTLVVNPVPACVLASNPASLTFKAGLSGTVQLYCNSATAGFTSPLAVAVTGAPSGMTAQLSAATFTPGSNISVNISTLVSVAGGTYNLGLSVSGGGFAKSITIPVTVQAQNILTLSASQTQVNLPAGANAQVTITTAALGSFSSAASFAAIVPITTPGLTVSLSKTSLPAPGSGSVVATISAAANSKAGNYVVQVTANAGGTNQSVYLGVTISSAPGFSFSVNTAALTVTQGGSGSFTTSNGNYTGGFNGQMIVSIAGLPLGASYGVTGANASNNMVNVTYGVTAASSTQAGTYPVTITATGGGVTHAVTIQLTIVKSGGQAR